MNLISTLAIAMGAGGFGNQSLRGGCDLGLLGRFAHLRLPGELEILTSCGSSVSLSFSTSLILLPTKCRTATASGMPSIPSSDSAGAVLRYSLWRFRSRSQVAAFLLGGGLALSAHGTKAGARGRSI